MCFLDEFVPSNKSIHPALLLSVIYAWIIIIYILLDIHIFHHTIMHYITEICNTL
jgi:hypothetical protein